MAGIQYQQLTASLINTPKNDKTHKTLTACTFGPNEVLLGASVEFAYTVKKI
jgi:hypothetical protein